MQSYFELLQLGACLYDRSRFHNALLTIFLNIVCIVFNIFQVYIVMFLIPQKHAVPRSSHTIHLTTNRDLPSFLWSDRSVILAATSLPFLWSSGGMEHLLTTATCVICNVKQCNILDDSLSRLTIRSLDYVRNANEIPHSFLRFHLISLKFI